MSNISNKGEAYFGIDAVNITISKYLDAFIKNSFAKGLTNTYILYNTPSKSTSNIISFFSKGVKLEWTKVSSKSNIRVFLFSNSFSLGGSNGSSFSFNILHMFVGVNEEACGLNGKIRLFKYNGFAWVIISGVFMYFTWLFDFFFCFDSSSDFFLFNILFLIGGTLLILFDI